MTDLLGWRTLATLPRGVRRGDIFAAGTDVLEATGGGLHPVLAICHTEAEARACAATLQRRKWRTGR